MSASGRLGRVVGERFFVEEELGAGGMASIYRGRDARLGGPVAIKFLRPSLREDPILRERFRREAYSLARLRHPGIVTVIDFGEIEGELYTVLELVHGRTIDEVLRENARAFDGKEGPVFDQILDALEACHAHDVVHRDMKPSNVMVSAERGADRVKLIDFGLARVATDTALKLTETGTVQGTPHYMAPEQCRGEDVGPEADIYSVGVVFYEMLAGAPPFRGSDAATFMAQHLFVEPPPLRRVAANVSAGVAAAVHQALAKRPEDRPTARALRATLAAAFRGVDPEALAAAASAERRHLGSLPRRERAIGRARTEATSQEQAPSATGTVVVWMPQDDRSASLQGCLGTAGMPCALWTTASVAELGRGDVAAVIVSARDLDRLAPLRATAPGVVVVVVDVAGPDQTTAAIRAGANDMLLAAAPDADVIPKLQRLLRRRNA